MKHFCNTLAILFKTIVPNNCKIFENQDSNLDEFQVTSIIQEKQSSKVYSFQKSPGLLGRCYFCYLADHKYNQSNDRSFSIKKKINEYAKFCLRFGIIGLQNSFKLNSNFASNYRNVVGMVLINVPLRIEDENFFKHFDHLVHLKLWYNHLNYIPPSIFEMEKLKIFLYQNRLNEADLNFKNMSSLEMLEIENLEIKDANMMVQMPDRIETIRISRSSFGHFFLNLNPENMINLKMSGIPLFDMDKYSRNNSLISKENFTKEIGKSKFLSFDFIEKLFCHFDANSNGYLESEEIIKINAFLFKKFLRIGPDFPMIIFQMTNLLTLDLSFQAITQIPDEIKMLKKLHTLILSNCVLLENISPELASLPLNKLDLNNCLSLVTPPPEIVRRGMDSVLTYLKRMISGYVKLKRTKLMLVGLGQAGKTTLLKSLKGNQDELSEVTDGINIDDWQVDLDDGSSLTFSMWDFAGQSVYYNTHQFFLTSRGVYLLVWNVRLGSEYAGLEFWLSSISCHAPGAPIFVVGTHIDQAAH
ncbi:serine threonine- kinase pats1 [Brachionus plicatilis]|uniref:Serine threonine-kinase pats1 n=1 Tax=Brachionus plicatilis TaxID=10195 RepID=A0A3M7S7Q2_BRAPC|nr:serine threonine- kinase pats1 [Brachionus plicatilis]